MRERESHRESGGRRESGGEGAMGDKSQTDEGVRMS